MIKKYFFSAALLPLLALAHSPPPIDVTNAAGGRSHSGYGYYGNDDYEGFVKLRKQCTERDRAQDLATYQAYCLGIGRPMPDLTQNQFQSMANNMVNNKFIDSVLNNVIDEVKLIDPSYSPASSSCLNPGITGTTATHREVRREAMSLNNALSAALLADTHTAANNFSNYRERLQINYPYLFNPNARYNELTALMQGALSTAYDNSLKITAHADTMSALRARMTADPALQTSLTTKLNEIKQSYANDLKAKVANLCQNNNQLYSARRDNATTIDFLHTNFRRDFQQRLIDLNDSDRAMANAYLCSQPFYYRPNRFDSDCDGVSDETDTDPNDPLAPTNNFNIDQPNATFNPPFGSHMQYNVSLAPTTNVITLRRPIKVNFNGLNATEKAAAIANLNRCGAELNTALTAQFDAFKATPQGAAFRNRTLALQMPITEDNTNSDFQVHRCWCSTCTAQYTPPGGSAQAIPKNTCRTSFTPEMTAALTDSTLNPGTNDQRWMDQADASNFTLSSLTGTSCHTIKHEFMHKLGLPDEYHNETYYPFNQIGPQASLMNGGDNVYARHMVFLMSPKACDRRSENYGL